MKKLLKLENMIIDAISNAGLYSSVSPLLAKAFAHLKTVNLENLADGKYEIDGTNIFMMINEGKALKAKADAALEVHDKYIDIQVLIQGREGFGWRDRAACKSPRAEMDTQKDIMFYDDIPSTYFTIEPGEFVIFMPGDAHAPLVGEGTVKKCIVKVLAV